MLLLGFVSGMITGFAMVTMGAMPPGTWRTMFSILYSLAPVILVSNRAMVMATTVVMIHAMNRATKIIAFGKTGKMFRRV